MGSWTQLWTFLFQQSRTGRALVWSQKPLSASVSPYVRSHLYCLCHWVIGKIRWENVPRALCESWICKNIKTNVLWCSLEISYLWFFLQLPPKRAELGLCSCLIISRERTMGGVKRQEFYDLGQVHFLLWASFLLTCKIDPLTLIRIMRFTSIGDLRDHLSFTEEEPERGILV